MVGSSTAIILGQHFHKPKNFQNANKSQGDSSQGALCYTSVSNPPPLFEGGQENSEV